MTAPDVVMLWRVKYDDMGPLWHEAPSGAGALSSDPYIARPVALDAALVAACEEYRGALVGALTAIPHSEKDFGSMVCDKIRATLEKHSAAGDKKGGES